MTPTALKDSLKALGWSQSRLAVALGVTKTTVSRWATDQIPIPQYAVAYLSLAMKVKEFSGDCLQPH
jgi:transcriptional regulator with XRE-family HTH domain